MTARQKANFDAKAAAAARLAASCKDKHMSQPRSTLTPPAVRKKITVEYDPDCEVRIADPSLPKELTGAEVNAETERRVTLWDIEQTKKVIAEQDKKIAAHAAIRDRQLKYLGMLEAKARQQ